MKKYVSGAGIIVCALFLISWGFTGHKTIGQIAFNHLTPQARSAVQELLADQSLADAATWADQVRNDPEYSNTASWHFINVPLGLSFEQFQQQVANTDKMNVYTALLKEEKLLTDPASTHEQKVAALKFVAHLVGDIHQPMHVSRAEDKGGNTIQVNYDGQGTNLHAL
jgi:S1/P1 Nuclease